MTRNIIFCAAGALLGFFIGFFIANNVSHAPSSVASARTTPTGPAAGPLDPNAPSSELPPNHPDISVAAAAGASAGGSLTGQPAATSPVAQSAMDKADRAPRDFAAQMAAAEVFYNLNDFATAALYLDRALALKPKDVDALTQMGNTKYDAGEYVAAATFYERSLAIKPDDPNVRTDLGLTYFLRNPPDPDRAIVEYRKSLAVDPQHEKSWQNLAAAAVFKRDKQTAREALGRLSAINPQNPALGSMRRSIEALP